MTWTKKFLPDWLLNFIRPYYHGALAWAASWYFGRPSDRLIVIGVTGTAGKSTTAAMLAEMLNFSGKKCGYITTVDFFDGDRHYMNKHGLSMPGGWLLQKSLKRMLNNGCQYAVVECTSEGLAQNRHLGINFDMAVFTNLSRAHLQAHGSFANYQQAKGKLFKTLKKFQITNYPPSLKLRRTGKLQIDPKIQKSIGVNLDDPMSGFFLSFSAELKFGVTFANVRGSNVGKLFVAEAVQSSGAVAFKLNGVPFVLSVLGEFNAQNAALAAACAEALGVELSRSAAALENFQGVRGRMENVPNGLGLYIIVDYGCEPASFRAAVESAAQLPHNRLVHVFGATGGHRDTEKRFEFGRTSAQFADKIIITNDDIYDSDPAEIAKNIEEGIKSFRLRQPEYKIILDRRAAIATALSEAQKKDIVLFTGKGSEQFLVLPGNKRIEWDEVSVVREGLKKLV